jgi:hypothetical protein
MADLGGIDVNCLHWTDVCLHTCAGCIAVGKQGRSGPGQGAFYPVGQGPGRRLSLVSLILGKKGTEPHTCLPHNACYALASSRAILIPFLLHWHLREWLCLTPHQDHFTRKFSVSTCWSQRMFAWFSQTVDWLSLHILCESHSVWICRKDRGLEVQLKW